MRERIISVLGVGVGVGKRVCFRVSGAFTLGTFSLFSQFHIYSICYSFT